MKILAIADPYIPPEYMESGLGPFREEGDQLDVRNWSHPSIVELQEANLAIEQGGPEAVTLSDELMADLAGFDVVVVQFAPISRAFIEAASDLKVIGLLRSGTENIDMQAATERGVTVLTTPGRNARAVAECTMGLILTEMRNLARAHACLKKGEWVRDFCNSSGIPELYEKTVGLVGFGAVARLVAGYLEAFGSKVIAYDPYVENYEGPVELVSLDEVMQRSDVISVHARLTEATQHMIGAEQLALMKPTAVLVNTARSGLIDEQALVKALQEKKIMGAALDVFDNEPLSEDDPLVALDNVTLVPHLAGSTVDAFRNSPKLMAEHLQNMLAGRGPLPVANEIEPTLRR